MPCLAGTSTPRFLGKRLDWYCGHWRPLPFANHATTKKAKRRSTWQTGFDVALVDGRAVGKREPQNRSGNLPDEAENAASNAARVGPFECARLFPLESCTLHRTKYNMQSTHANAARKPHLTPSVCMSACHLSLFQVLGWQKCLDVDLALVNLRAVLFRPRPCLGPRRAVKSTSLWLLRTS